MSEVALSLYGQSQVPECDVKRPLGMNNNNSSALGVKYDLRLSELSLG